MGKSHHISGRELREKLRQTPEGLIVAMYLMTSPHANMLGLYYIPLLYIAHETGLGFEGAKGFKEPVKRGFVAMTKPRRQSAHEMARFQVAESLKPADNRCKNVQKEYDSLPSSPYLSSFFDKYAQAFCMTSKAWRKRQNR